MELYLIIWQEHDGEPDYIHVVAKNLTEERALSHVRKFLAKEWENMNPKFSFFWYTPVQSAEGIGSKSQYRIRLEAAK